MKQPLVKADSRRASRATSGSTLMLPSALTRASSFRADSSAWSRLSSSTSSVSSSLGVSILAAHVSDRDPFRRIEARPNDEAAGEHHVGGTFDGDADGVHTNGLLLRLDDLSGGTVDAATLPLLD